MEYQRFFEEAKKKKITNIQISEKTVVESSVELINGEMESFDDGNNTNYGIKAEYKGKTVTVNSNYLDSDIIDLLTLKAKVTDSKYEDDYLDNKKPIPHNEPLDFDISCEIRRLKELSEIRKEYPGVEKMSFYFSESYTNTRIINSNGVDISINNFLHGIEIKGVRRDFREILDHDYFDKNINVIIYAEKIKEIGTKNNDKMAFIDASDEVSKIDIVLFPKTYKKYNDIKNGKIYLIKGRVEKRFDKYQLNAFELTELK